MGKYGPLFGQVEKLAEKGAFLRSGPAKDFTVHRESIRM